LDPHQAQFLADAYEEQDDEGLNGLLRRGLVIPLSNDTEVTVTDPDEYPRGFPTKGFSEVRIRSGKWIGQQCYLMRGFLK
jgi:hypothetical protein